VSDAEFQEPQVGFTSDQPDAALNQAKGPCTYGNRTSRLCSVYITASLARQARSGGLECELSLFCVLLPPNPAEFTEFLWL